MRRKIQFLIFVIVSLSLSLSAQHALNITGKTLMANTTKAYAYYMGAMKGFILNKSCVSTQGVIQPTKNWAKPPEQNGFIVFTYDGISLFT